eukprot:s4697_g4.t1
MAERQARPHCPEEETWEENLALRRQLADVHHQLRNLKENYTEELSFWRRRALELQLELTATERRAQGHGGAKSNGDLSQLEPMPPAAEDSQLRQAQQPVAKQLEELKASKEEAEARLAQSELLSEQLKDQASQQAVELLTREGLEPADTFARSLGEVEAPTLRWAQHQIEMRWRQLASRKGSGKNDARWKKKSKLPCVLSFFRCRPARLLDCDAAMPRCFELPSRLSRFGLQLACAAL